MAFINTTTQSQGFSNPFRGFGAAFMRLMTKMAESGARSHQLRTLHAKSDAELAEMGLRREDIVRHVFRDVMYM